MHPVTAGYTWVLPLVERQRQPLCSTVADIQSRQASMAHHTRSFRCQYISTHPFGTCWPLCNAGSHLTSVGWEALGRQLPSLTTLDVTDSHISDADLRTLVASQAQAQARVSNSETEQQEASASVPAPLFPSLKTLAVSLDGGRGWCMG
jgi:hypothetical protein